MRKKRWLFAAILVPCLLELTLRAAGYTGKVPYLLPDPHLRWIPKSGFSQEGRGVSIRVDSGGFRGPERPPPAPGVLRIACMGDSCTWGSAVAGACLYPEALETLLTAAGRPARVVNAGVPGYSVFQGLRDYRRRIASLRADVVTVYYGWNDHWENGDGRPDERQVDTWRARLLGLRVLQLAKSAWMGRGSPAQDPRGSPPSDAVIDTDRLRTPPSRYAELPRELVRAVRADGARVILVTAPCGLDPESAAHVPFGAGSGAPRRMSPRLYVDLHDRYVGLTRRVADEEAVECVDLAALFPRPGSSSPSPYFDNPLDDPVHANDAGMKRIAELLCERILSTPPEAAK